MRMVLCFSMVTLMFGSLMSGWAAEPPKGKPSDGTYVEIDFSPLPEPGPPWEFAIVVNTTDPDISFDWGMRRAAAQPPGPWPKGQAAAITCEIIAEDMKECKFRVKIVDKTKLRVYGRTFNDKFLPAIEGKVTSPNLKKEELPKVKNPPKA